MNRKRKIIIVLSVIIFAGLVAWLLTLAPSKKVFVTLIGYTNNTTGISTFGYTSNTILYTSFAVLRVHNSSHSDFACFGWPHPFANAAGKKNTEVIELRGALNTPSLRKLPLTGGDFVSSPGKDVLFAIPLDKVQGKGQCGLSLIRIHNYKYRWQYDLVVLAMRWGLLSSDKGGMVVSEEFAH